MNQDLRTFLSALEKTYPEELVRVKKEISTDLEISVFQEKLASTGINPVIYFEKRFRDSACRS